MTRTKVGPLPDMKEFETFLQDLSTTKYHEAIIETATKIAEKLEEVEGVLLKGSLGHDGGDIFSDVDFQIIHNSEPSVSQTILERFIDEFEKLETIIQYFPSTAFPNDCIIYVRPFVKFELSVAAAQEIGERWSVGSAKILFDRNGMAKRVVEKAQKISFNLKDVMTVLEGRALALPVFCFITAGHLVRGEEMTALHDIDWIRNDMLRISGWLLGQYDEGCRRAEERFPDDVLDYYNSSRVKTVDEIWSSFQILLDWYEKWLVPEYDRLNIPHSQIQVTQMRMILQMLQKK